MGATIQRTRFSVDRKRVLQDGSGSGSGEGQEVKVISGIDVLSNNQVCPMSPGDVVAKMGQVNLLSSVVCAVLLAHVA